MTYVGSLIGCNFKFLASLRMHELYLFFAWTQEGWMLARLAGRIRT